MSKLRIEATHWIAENVSGDGIESPEDIEVNIFDDDKLVITTTLDLLVCKFLILSSKYAQAMSVLNMIEENHENRIVVAQENDMPREK